MTGEFWITTAAIFLGPLIAVLITYKLQRTNDRKERRLAVFRSLMATRRTPLSPERVQALNLVEIEFFGNKSVLESFSRLLETYNDLVRWRSDDPEVRKAVVQEVDDRTAELLREMGKALKYKLEHLSLLRGGYYPEAFSNIEMQQQEIREFLVGLNQGSKVLPTAVVDVRHPEKILEQAQQTHLIMSSVQETET